MTSLVPSIQVILEVGIVLQAGVSSIASISILLLDTEKGRLTRRVVPEIINAVPPEIDQHLKNIHVDSP